MSSLKGIYVCKELGAELNVTEAKDSTGNGKGIFSLGELEVNVSIHYHFYQSSGPETTLEFNGWKDNPNKYLAGSGALPDRSMKLIDLAGGYSTIAGTTGFSGKFIRA